MADGKGECCIARWGGGGHVASTDCNTSKMDMIMLKFRPIAPKPVAGTTTASEGGSQGSGSGRQAKGGGRGRKKSSNNSNNNSVSSTSRRCNHNNGRKRKSSSPGRRRDLDLMVYNEGDINDHKTTTDLTLLPLFPEAPDLSPTMQDQVHNNMPFSFQGNYNN